MNPRRERRWTVIGCVVVLVLAGVAVLTLGVGTVDAANNTTNVSDVAPYYNNTSDTVNWGSWMSGRTDVTLDNVIHYLTRIGGFVIGSSNAQGGVGNAGLMLTGLLTGGAFLAATVGVGTGPVGGVVLAVAVTGGLTGVGLAPTWVFAVLMFVLGLVLTAAFIRSTG